VEHPGTIFVNVEDDSDDYDDGSVIDSQKIIGVDPLGLDSLEVSNDVDDQLMVEDIVDHADDIPEEGSLVGDFDEDDLPGIDELVGELSPLGISFQCDLQSTTVQGEQDMTVAKSAEDILFGDLEIP
jgi:hypothetical protein